VLERPASYTLATGLPFIVRIVCFKANRCAPVTKVDSQPRLEASLMAKVGVLADQRSEVVAFEKASYGTRKSDRKNLPRVVIDGGVILRIE
jgi:hypothetical protein